MAFVFRITDSAVDSQTWIVLLGNGRYSTSTGSAHPDTWSAMDEALPEGETWARSNQKIQSWEAPRNIAYKTGSFGGAYATTKPSGASGIGAEGKQYVFNQAENPPAGNWGGIHAGAFREVVFDASNNKFVRFSHNTMVEKTTINFSGDAQNYNGAHGNPSAQNFVTGYYQLYYGTIFDGTFVGVYQKTSSDPSGLKGNRIVVNSGSISEYPLSDTFEANITHSSGESRIGRPHKGGGIWLAGYTGGVLKSTDNAVNWTPQTIRYEGANCRIQHVAYSSGTSTWIAVGTVGIDVNNGTGIVLRSTDNATTWTPVKVGGIANGGFFSVATSNDGVWLVGGQNREVYRSINDGLNWTGPIPRIYNDTFDGNNSHYDVISILFQSNNNI